MQFEDSESIFFIIKCIAQMFPNLDVVFLHYNYFSIPICNVKMSAISQQIPLKFSECHHTIAPYLVTRMLW